MPWCVLLMLHNRTWLSSTCATSLPSKIDKYLSKRKINWAIQSKSDAIKMHGIDAKVNKQVMECLTIDLNYWKNCENGCTKDGLFCDARIWVPKESFQCKISLLLSPFSQRLQMIMRNVSCYYHMVSMQFYFKIWKRKRSCSLSRHIAP